jgi:hypothetical protein
MLDGTNTIEIIAWTFAVLATVKSLADLFAFIAAKTASTKDDAISGTINKCIGFLGKLLDYISANSRPKA